MNRCLWCGCPNEGTAWECRQCGECEFAPFTDDDTLSVVNVSFASGVSKRYVQADIKAGRLSARKIGNRQVIKYTDFEQWMNNPNRGSHSKSKGK